MTIGTEELAGARETVRDMLDEFGLAAYLYELEPRNDHWELRVECAFDGGWETVTIAVSKAELAGCQDDAAARKRMLGQWRDRLAACKTR